MQWFYLALLSAITLALADTLTKKYFRNYSGLEILASRFLIITILLLPIALYNGMPSYEIDFWFYMALVIPLELLAMWLYMIAIRDSPLYLTLPYMAFTPVFNILTGFLILGEQVSLQGFTGIFIVVCGAYLLNIDFKQGLNLRRIVAPFRAIAQQRGSLLMLLVASIYSITSVLGKKALLFTNPQTFGTFYYSIIGVLLLSVLLITRPAVIKRSLQNIKPALLIGILLSIMVVTHFMAIISVEVAYMITVKRLNMLFGVIFAAMLLQESVSRQHLFAILLMLTGTALILI